MTWKASYGPITVLGAVRKQSASTKPCSPGKRENKKVNSWISIRISETSKIKQGAEWESECACFKVARYGLWEGDRVEGGGLNPKRTSHPPAQIGSGGQGPFTNEKTLFEKLFFIHAVTIKVADFK